MHLALLMALDMIIIFMGTKATIERLFIVRLLTKRMRRINDTLHHTSLLLVLPLHDREYQAIT